MPTAIEEFLRFYAPVTMARLVKHDMEYMGCPMKEYDWMMLGFPAANRDPAAFTDADRFVIDRLENRHLAFGLGIHRCIGSNLARLELRVALEEFIARYPRFTLADPAAVTWAPGEVRGPRRRAGARPARPRPGAPAAQSPAIHASTSSGSRGSAAERLRRPSAVTRTSSSMRTPMPRYSSGTVRSSGWK